MPSALVWDPPLVRISYIPTGKLSSDLGSTFPKYHCPAHQPKSFYAISQKFWRITPSIRVVCYEASYLMPASFFPSPGHVYAILDSCTSLRQDPAPPITTHFDGECHKLSSITRRLGAVQNTAERLSRSSRFIVLSGSVHAWDSYLLPVERRLVEPHFRLF